MMGAEYGDVLAAGGTGFRSQRIGWPFVLLFDCLPYGSRDDELLLFMVSRLQ